MEIGVVGCDFCLLSLRLPLRQTQLPFFLYPQARDAVPSPLWCNCSTHSTPGRATPIYVYSQLGYPGYPWVYRDTSLPGCPKDNGQGLSWSTGLDNQPSQRNIRCKTLQRVTELLQNSHSCGP